MFPRTAVLTGYISTKSCKQQDRIFSFQRQWIEEGNAFILVGQHTQKNITIFSELKAKKAMPRIFTHENFNYNKKQNWFSVTLIYCIFSYLIKHFCESLTIHQGPNSKVYSLTNFHKINTFMKQALRLRNRILPVPRGIPHTLFK